MNAYLLGKFNLDIIRVQIVVQTIERYSRSLASRQDLAGKILVEIMLVLFWQLVLLAVVDILHCLQRPSLVRINAHVFEEQKLF